MDYLFGPLNPWWNNPHWDTEHYERREFQDIMRLLDFQKNKKPRAPILVGPRRVGKTTLMYQVVRAFLKKIPASNILYYSFERADPEIQHKPDAISDIISVWGDQEYDPKKPRLLLLDEIQNVKDWDGRMKIILESTFQAPLLIVMTGSSSFDLIGKSLQTLHGVIRRIFVPPFSLVDFWLMQYPQDIDLVKKTEEWRKLWLQSKNESFGTTVHVQTLKREMWNRALALQKKWLSQGGFPEFWSDTSQQTASELFDYYVKRVVQDDILRIKGISQSTEVARFLKYCYFHPGGELNITTAGQELGIPRSTLDIMLDLLFHAGYIKVIPRYSGNVAPMRQRHVKIYPIDHSLIPKRIRFDGEEPSGMAIETMVINTFFRMEEAEIYFFRKKIGREIQEIDFVVRVGLRLIAVEVKKRITRNDIENFRKTVSKLLPQATNRILLCWDTDEKGLIRDSVSIDNPEYIEIQPLWKLALGLPISLLVEGE